MNLKALVKKLASRPKFTEKPDPKPIAAPFKFDKPKSLTELVQEAVASAQFRMMVEREGAGTIDDFDDFGDESDMDELDFESGHELVFDSDLGKEVSKAEKSMLDKERQTFDRFVAGKQKEAREKRRAVKEEQKASE